MTREEFDNYAFNAGTEFFYEGEYHPVVGVHFTEALLGLDCFDDRDDLTWVRCESGHIKKGEK